MVGLEKEFIPYNEALELKLLRFNEPCFKEFHYKRLVNNSTGSEITNYELIELYGEKDVLTVPTFSQAFRWFRDKYLLEGLILPQVQSILAPTPAYFIAIISYKDEKWEEKFNSSDDKDEKNFLHYGTYEEAELACLRKLIEIIKNDRKA